LRGRQRRSGRAYLAVASEKGDFRIGTGPCLIRGSLRAVVGLLRVEVLGVRHPKVSGRGYVGSGRGKKGIRAVLGAEEGQLASDASISPYETSWRLLRGFPSPQTPASPRKTRLKMRLESASCSATTGRGDVPFVPLHSGTALLSPQLSRHKPAKYERCKRIEEVESRVGSDTDLPILLRCRTTARPAHLPPFTVPRHARRPSAFFGESRPSVSFSRLLPVLPVSCSCFSSSIYTQPRCASTSTPPR
jgi:hypothetical protein